MKARASQNHDNKIATQVSFNPTAANIMDMLCIFVISKQFTFFSVLVIIFSNMSCFCFNYRNTFFIHVMNYFSVVLRIIFINVYQELFFNWAENFFFAVSQIYFLVYNALQSLHLKWNGSSL